METSRIGSSSTVSGAKVNRANVVLSMPNITSPIRGIVDSVTKDGIMNIKTSSGEVKIYSSNPLTSGQNVIVSINTTKAELNLKVVPDSGSSYGSPVNPVSNDMGEGSQNFFVFKLPSKFQAQMAENLQLYPTFSSPSRELKSSPNIDVDSGGTIQFLSYVSRGGLSDTFGKSLQLDPKLINTFPTMANLIQTLPEFIRKVEGKSFSHVENKRLRMDLESLQTLPDTLSDEEYKFMLIPINDGQKLIPAQFFFKKEEIDDENNRTIRKFSVELNMDKLGHITVDGLHIKQNKDSSLSLSVRTETPLPESIESDLRELFKVAEEITGNSGSIAFGKSSSKINSKLTKALHNYCKDKVSNYWA